MLSPHHTKTSSNSNLPSMNNRASLKLKMLMDMRLHILNKFSQRQELLQWRRQLARKMKVNNRLHPTIGWEYNWLHLTLRSLKTFWKLTTTKSNYARRFRPSGGGYQEWDKQCVDKCWQLISTLTFWTKTSFSACSSILSRRFVNTL